MVNQSQEQLSQTTTNYAAPAWQASLRETFPLLVEGTAYLQTGSLAPLSGPVRTAIIQGLDREGTAGLVTERAWTDLLAEVAAVRDQLARFLGVSATEIGWTSNTSFSIRHVISNFTWQPGDTIISSSTEHVSTRALFQGLAERHGVNLVTVPAEAGDENFLRDLERALEKRKPALLLLSHVSCQDGRRLPVVQATRLAHASNVPVLIDGAQAAGQFPVNIAEIGCDFYAGSAHKWLLGPAGLGYLYIAAAWLERFAPEFLMTAPSQLQSPAGAPAPLPVARRMEAGTENLALRTGLGTALTQLEAIGLAPIETEVARLSAILRAGLQALPGMGILTPECEHVASGIISFTLPRNSLERVRFVVQQLQEKEQVVVKVQPERPAVRVSIAAFNTAEDIERLLSGLGLLLEKLPATRI